MREMTVMKTPALAVVGPDRQIVRSTEGFRHYENAEKIAQTSPELECVLTGYADAATIKFGDLKIEVEAITDASGRRQAKLTLPPVATAERRASASTPVAPDEAAAEEVPVSRPTEASAAPPPAPPPTLSETAELLQRNLELARKWADRDEALQQELAQARAAAARAAEEAKRWQGELEQSQTELAAARAEAEGLRGRSAEALKLAGELDQTLERFRAWLGEFEPALKTPAAPAGSLAAS